MKVQPWRGHLSFLDAAEKRTTLPLFGGGCGRRPYSCRSFFTRESSAREVVCDGSSFTETGSVLTVVAGGTPGSVLIRGADVPSLP